MKRFGTTREELEHALRVSIRRGDELDWDTIGSKEAMDLAYQMSTSMTELAGELGISREALRQILVIHGVRLRVPGGLRKKNRAELEPTQPEELHEIGRGYGFSDKELALLRACASERVRVCPTMCPLALFCWDGPTGNGRRKKKPCGLQDHLLAVGLMRGCDIE